MLSPKNLGQTQSIPDAGLDTYPNPGLDLLPCPLPNVVNS